MLMVLDTKREEYGHLYLVLLKIDLLDQKSDIPTFAKCPTPEMDCLAIN